eukprot:1192040-Prorocentrum_minimum.AAC.2
MSRIESDHRLPHIRPCTLDYQSTQWCLIGLIENLIIGCSHTNWASVGAGFLPLRRCSRRAPLEAGRTCGSGCGYNSLPVWMDFGAVPVERK